MANILGMAAIRINGREIKTEGKSTLNPGGYARQQHMGGGKVWGNSRKMAAPSIKLTIAADRDVDVIESKRRLSTVWSRIQDPVT